MILLSLLLTSFVLTCAEVDSQDYCYAKGQSCSTETPRDEKFVLYDVNPPEGFNLRRDVYMRFAIMMSEAKKHERRQNWNLVLPPWFNLYHWKTADSNKPVPWSMFFDVESLKAFAPVVELFELFSKTKRKYLEIDRLYVLQNFPDAFENGVFDDKWEIDRNCDYSGSFWGYKNITVKETICVKYQGQISKLWELISLHSADKYVMFAHGEIPLHDYYGSKTFWDCRKSMKFNKNLINKAKKFIYEKLDCNENQCNTYISVHWRRQDFARARISEVPSLLGTAIQIDKAIKKYHSTIDYIFIASDAQNSELIQLEHQLKHLGYKVHFYIPSKLDLEQFSDGGIAIIDQIICSHAAYFIGTHESTFTFRIQEEREILGFKSSTTFNRLCPDTGKCSEPSKWTIVD
ncbi:GDP-fucose protein O-fucosyltransferase 2 [Pararge aegeria]|uniref:GDP-fucose protein O-fucosyltransferase 2 n=2 Tax=Pararge aegeria TaxID=116150 RepID=A0A8S4QYW8_9NEOP|nr:GDP-fucose protein O-fucosyltransferase 2 [Pararge aegeria]CAH2227585.1 jg24181 [Pararge aegeria aegeria]